MDAVWSWKANIFKADSCQVCSDWEVTFFQYCAVSVPQYVAFQNGDSAENMFQSVAHNQTGVV